MLPASKHTTIVIGVDTHVTTNIPFNPIHPYIGFIFDVGDCIPVIGCKTNIQKCFRGSSTTSGVLGTASHIPIASPPFAMQGMMGNESSNFYGASNAFIEGCRISVAPNQVMTCNDVGIPLSFLAGKGKKPKASLFAPTSVSIDIPMGMPVLVGNSQIPDIGSMLMGLVMSLGMGKLMKVGGKLAKKGAQAAKKAATSVLKGLNKGLKKMNTKWTDKLSAKLCKMGFEPVNLITGAVEYAGVDFELPGPLPLCWERVWYSDSRWQGTLGHGCHWKYDMRIEFFREDNVMVVTLPDGRPAPFNALLFDEEEFNRREQLLLRNRGTHYELFDYSDRLTYIFPLDKDATELFLSRVENEAGHGIDIKYQGSRIKEVIDSAGRHLPVTTDEAGRIVRVAIQKNQIERETLIEYTYNEEGDMTGITDALGQTTRIVYRNHLMVKKTDRNGQAFYWEYDGVTSGSRCIHTWGDGGLLEGYIEYHKGYNLVTNSLGHTTRYDFTPEGYVLCETNPLGDRIYYDYTPEGDLYREVDAEGNITGYNYNELGQLTTVHYPDGTKELNIYDEEGRVLSTITPGKATTVFTYNDKGLLGYVVSPDNEVTRYIYNNSNLICCIESDGNRNIHLNYDEQYNLIEAELPDGLRSEWKYDYKGQVTKSIDPGRGFSAFEYDALGRITSALSPDGNKVHLTYNAYDEVVRARDHERTVDFEYTPLGSLNKRTENGKSLFFSYNTEEQLTGLRNEGSERYAFQRDAAGRIVTEKGFDGITRHYYHTPTGKVRRVDRPGGLYTEYTYDNMGRLCRADYSDGSFDNYRYDDNGLLVEAANGNSLLKITRDRIGRVLEEWQDGHTVQSIYNKLGERTDIKSSLGANLSMSYTAGGMLSGTSAVGWDMQLKYDSRGLEIERSLTGGVISSYDYDNAGRIRSHKVISKGSEQRKMRYQWSTNDRLVTIVNELNNRNTWFDYDSMGNLTGSTYCGVEQLFRVPDAVGNLYKSPDRTDRKYGASGRLLETEDTVYKYDDEGNLIRKIKDTGEEWGYLWNSNGSLKEVVRPDGQTVSFEYDALQRRTAKIYNNQITRWVWDGNTPLHEWKYDLKDRPEIKWDEFGFVYKDKEEPTDDITTWVFEEGTFRPAAKLTESHSYSIVTDYLGTPAQMFNERGEKTWEARLDIYGKVASFEGSSQTDCPFRYQGQYEDEETGLYYNRFRYYSSEEGLYLSQDPIRLEGNNPTLYGYVCNINIWLDQLGLETVRLRHYTSNKGLKGIQESMEIKAYDQNKVFAEKAKGKPLSSTAASEKYLIEKSSARNYIEFDVDANKVTKEVNPLTGNVEYTVKGDVKLDPNTTKFYKRCK